MLSPSEVDLIAIDSRDLALRTMNQIKAPINAATTIPTAVNVPATFPVLFQKLSGVVAFTVVTCVCAVAGGTVGVIITVCILPRTVVTNAEGVGVHGEDVGDVGGGGGGGNEVGGGADDLGNGNELGECCET